MLSAKHLLFVQKYLNHGNAGRAALEAGYQYKGTGPKLLRRTQIAAAVAEGMKQVAKASQLTAAAVLDEIRKLAFSDITQVYDNDGAMKPRKKMSKDLRRAIQSIESTDIYRGRGADRTLIGHGRKVKMHDKVRSLDMLARHFKLLTDMHEISGKDGGPQVILTLPANGSEKPEEVEAVSNDKIDGN